MRCIVCEKEREGEKKEMVSMKTLDFAMSGEGAAASGNFTIVQAQQLAVDSGYVKKNADPSKPLAQRADMQAMFKAFNVTSLSSFKQLFYTTKLAKNGQRMSAPKVPAKAAQAAVPEPEANFDVPDVSEYATLSESWDGNHMKWRMIQKPGGAHMKPQDWYRLYAAKKQAEHGDCTEEQPMWAEHGGLDFDGRERYGTHAHIHSSVSMRVCA